MAKAEKNIVLLVLLAASAISLPILSTQLSLLRDSTALSVTPQVFEALITDTTKVASFFSTPGCSDCDRMRPIWQALSEKYSGAMSFVEVEYSLMTSEVFDKYGVLETPTFILFVNGANVSRYDGSFASPDNMDQFLQTAFSTEHAKSSPMGNQLTLLSVSESPPLLISIILGFSVFASPCVLPLLPGYLAILFAGRKKNRSRICVASASSLVFGAASILLVGFVFVILGDAFWSLLLLGKLLISFVLLALGLATLLDVSILAPKVVNVSSITGVSARSVCAYSFLFGFLSLGCSLPLLVGAVLNIIGGLDVYSMSVRLLAFAVGFASPLAALTFATGAGVSVSTLNLRKMSGIMSKVGGASLVAASVLLLVTL